MREWEWEWEKGKTYSFFDTLDMVYAHDGEHRESAGCIECHFCYSGHFLCFFFFF